MFFCGMLPGCRNSAPGTDERTPAPAVESAPPVAISTAEPAAKSPSADETAILFINVGRADATVLRIGGHTALIDTGTKSSAAQLIAGLNLLGIVEIDALFITHSHADHMGGLAAIAANYDVGMVYFPALSEQNKEGEGKIAARCEKLGLPYTALWAGDGVAVGVTTFNVLGPLVLDAEEDNENSLVLRAVLGNTSFLFTGDMESREEASLLSAGTDVSSDVLKVANHGNPDATGDAFARAVSPDIAVIPTDTREDANSANPRVIAALSPAAVYITEAFPVGVLLTLDDEGRPVVSNPAKETPNAALSLVSIDAATQTITIGNDGDAALDLSGYILYADRSDAVLRFPDGATLGAGGTARVTAANGGGDYAFSNEDKPLNAKKQNTVTLYAPNGTLISTLVR